MNEDLQDVDAIWAKEQQSNLDAPKQISHESGGPRRKASYDSAAEPYEYFDITELEKLPEPSWLVDGVLPEVAIVLLFGASNAYKSFLALDLALSVASGREWHGHPVKRGRVIYIANEGAAGIARRRVPGWLLQHGLSAEDLSGWFAMVRVPIYMDAPETEARLRATIEAALGGEVALIVSDVLQGNLEGSDQDPEVISARNATISAIIREYGVTEIAITHSPWHDTKRARGHTHLWGNADTRLKAEGDPEELQATLSVDRHKDADSGMIWKFQMEKIQLNEETSTLAPVLMEEGIGIGREKKGTQKDYGLRLLERAIGEDGKSIPGEHVSTRGVKISLWQQYCKTYHLTSPSSKADSQDKAFRRTMSALQKSGKIITKAEMVWIPKG